MYINFEEMAPSQIYFTMTQTVIPRPIAWILSENESGNYNLAPFSYFNAVCSDPPLIVVSVGKKPDGSGKDTRANIIARENFVVHIAHEEMLEELNQSAATLPAGESEIEQQGLELESFDNSPLPRLAASRVAFNCTLHEYHEIGASQQALILGLVRGVYLDDSVVGEDYKGRFKALADKIDPIARLGASEYVTFGKIRTIRRPA